MGRSYDLLVFESILWSLTLDQNENIYTLTNSHASVMVMIASHLNLKRRSRDIYLFVAYKI